MKPQRWLNQTASMNASLETGATHDSPPTSNSKSANSKSSKRSRIARACDFCRRKKSKCYGAPGQPCSSCISYGVTCEFTDG
ncbi:hypothetical protein BDB00DRAFT_315292 [Zychaea mexicana]|uniref:uncharacterized protein n=1 Tax=Zychaea mexicana TaxID=64656 RepID=UPI0022FE87D7|nr:uncharacterized protein BDB00DRAFT_315292 [Zychaea mexicana]KAI9494423.1 hypothetical protein BDB00DRAFT_315292 [Zychaea mexicana]